MYQAMHAIQLQKNGTKKTADKLFFPHRKFIVIPYSRSPDFASTIIFPSPKHSEWFIKIMSAYTVE